MNSQPDIGDHMGEVREDFVSASDYCSKEFAEWENERLWPRVWQMACREEDVPEVGDFYTYDIVDDSIIIIRSAPGEIKAFHNACAHRGRQLTEGCGHASKLQCPFHGWQFGFDGKPLHVVDREDWGDKLRDEDISLIPVKVGIWGGWVYINMDLDCESLDDFLAPAKAILDPLDMSGLRYHWVKSAIVPSNWKTVLGLFNEAYHLQQAHSQVLRFQDDVTESHVHGRHGMFESWDALPPGIRSQRLGPPLEQDIRQSLHEYVMEYYETLQCAHPITMVDAVDRMMEEVPEGTPAEEVMAKVMQFTFEDAAGRGVEIPPITPEEMHAVGSDWHLFANQILLPGPLTCLAYRARPNGHDPDSAIFDVYSLLRYPPGQEPNVEPERCDDLTDISFWPLILIQDFENLAALQRGLKSRGFRGARTNPKQESAVSNFHRALRDFMRG
ncbi:MAG: aromatic ring-hydroxylating dioxygenase subunit alpha [Novosphingobium sp.]|nr:aromatic ring-hydroxylating dioxygenase subunit alpha [Novosphingobium sp.]